MNLQDRLKSLALKAAFDFDTIAAKEPDIIGEDDDSLRNHDLDQALAIQKAERDNLWKVLYELEEQQREMKVTHVFDEALTPERKRLATLLYEEQELAQELEKQENEVHLLNPDNGDLLADLQFRQRLQTLVKEMGQLVNFLKAELNEARSLYQQEVRVVDECAQVKAALTSKIHEVETSNGPSVVPTTRTNLIKARQDYKAIMGYLVDFLTEFYPPHLNDNVELTADFTLDNQCTLKTILEDLVNRAFGNPSNPYIKLVDGTYWSPYIETLIKGGIAERDPHNPKRIRLVDFRLHISD
ncbi:centromere protein Cenp-K [Chlamydoabsidia padenii]|nr:centromere protein Cenp-K [Chlamydoabsidia padenii]